MKSRLLFIFLLVFAFRISAQRADIAPPNYSRISVGASAQYGFLWSHRYNMGHLVKKHLVSYELDVTKNTTGDKSWHEPYHYPTAGAALHFIPLGNPDELGYAIGLYPFVNFPLGKIDRHFKLDMRVGWGLGWITKPFDPIENHKNVAIGSHLNTCFALRLIGLWRLNDINFVEFGIGMTHFSNGCVTLPNLGLNLPMISVGFHHAFWTLKETPHDLQHDVSNPSPIEKILADHRWHVSALLVTGMNDIDPPGGNRFGVMNLLTNVMKQTSRKSRWGGGFDLMYSDALRHKLVYDSVNINWTGALQPGLNVCYEWVLGRISFPEEIGVYLYTRYKENGPVYNRFSIRYLVGNNFLINLSLKTHFAKAEYWEVGFGWRF